MSYRHSRAVVTGGLGFIGSNLTLALLRHGARVTVIDSLVDGCGGAISNLGGALNDVKLIRRDIGEAESFAEALRDADVVFNLAGEISHIHSMRDPLRDFRLNAESQLRFLLALRRVNRGVRVVYAGTRQIYGRPSRLPVAENHPVEVVDFNGIHKFAAWQYHVILTGQRALDAVELRLTNVYGPRLALEVSGQGFLGVFFRLAMDGKPIRVYGDGTQLRDPVYVEDAVEAFLACGQRAGGGRVFNIGGPAPLRLADLAGAIAKAAGGKSSVTCVPFPPEQAQVDIGSYVADWTRIRTELGWAPQVEFEHGAATTIAYFEKSAGSLSAHPRAEATPHADCG